MNNRTIALAAGAVLILSNAALAQYDSDKPSTSTKQAQLDKQVSSGSIYRLSRMIGRDVEFSDGNAVGEIENYAVDYGRGQVNFVILDVDSDIAGSDKLIAVPYKALRLDRAVQGNQPVVLNVQSDKLRSAPAITSGNWRELNDPEWIQRVNQHYGISADSSSTGGVHIETDHQPSMRDHEDDDDDQTTNYPGMTGNPHGEAAGDPDGDKVSDQSGKTTVHTTTSTTRVLRADRFIGADVENPQNNDLGEVEDLLVELESGRVAYVVMSTGGFMGMGDRLLLVPMHAVKPQLRNDQAMLVLNVEPNRLEDAPSFDEDRWPSTINAETDRQVHAFYNVDQQGGVYGFTPSDDRDAGDLDVKSMVDGWPQASRRAAQDMMQRYGQPDVVSDQVLMWYETGPFTKTCVFRREVQHQFPTQHMDVLAQTINYRVPADMMDELAQFDGSLMAYRTAGELTACCHQEPMNILALNLAHEVVTGKRTPQEAREFLAQTARQFMQGESSEYTQRLMFNASAGSAADPDQPFRDSGSGSNRNRMESD